MNRFPKYLRQARDGSMSDRNVRTLAARLKIRGRALLVLPMGCTRALLGSLSAAARMDASGDEALRRLKTESGHVQALVRCAQEEERVFLPSAQHGVRVLLLARCLIAFGENRLDAQKLTEEIIAFDRAQNLEMQEIQRIPAALRIALCEALKQLAGEILQAAEARGRAARWVHGGGRGSILRQRSPFFMEHALQLCSDMELPALHARVERVADRRGERIEHIAAHVHRVAADHCMRLDNLMHLRHMLQALDWEKCFARISGADIELNADPAGVYGRMDADSKSCIRENTAELARHLRLQESVVVRCALRAAQTALQENGAHDPRSTVCWYLAEDAGREQLCRQLGDARRLRRMIPDTTGHRTVALVVLTLAVVLALLLCAMGVSVLWIYALPLAWGCVMQLIGRFHARWVKPGRLLKLKLESVPDSARTLVVLPVLLSSEARAREMIAHMEALGCLERDANIDFLLLGDFRDANAPELAEDEAILASTRRGVEQLNRQADRQKYYYLHRARTFRERDARWMGENRKRGALMALNRLLLNQPDALAAFAAEGECAPALVGRYRYVVTLDADTEYLPGTVRRLIGAMLHPLNRVCALNGRRRGYAVLQPNMQLTAQACVNDYVEITAGRGGVDSYPVSVSDFYQDMTGRGCFAGKGIYDVQAFALATEGRLRDDTILSHDLIEGILAGAGFVNDISFYDTAPEDLKSDLVRLNRWTRGDWQLLPVLFSRMGIAAVDRMKMAGNLLRSLYAPALLGLLIHSAWLDASGAFCLGLLLAFLEPLLRGGRRAWRRALFRLAVLPCQAACQLDAILRTLWRLAVSRRHLMDWVPAADAGAAGGNPHLPGRVAALLMLPGLLRPFWIPAVLALAALFLVGAGWAEDLSRRRTGEREPLGAAQVAFLNDLALRTWNFFKTYVPEDGCGLPPDNVQLDPPAGVALRTSPTNIGLYMMSCLSAHALGILDQETLLRRLNGTLSTLDRLEKWNGQLYNWYDMNDLNPLRPRYVSAVDSGNLAGALLLCARMTRAMDEGIADRLRNLAQGMNLAALYDDARHLFRIGVDVESGQFSQSHYDLYASEARILSYCAMMLGQVPPKHWKHLSRACVRVDRQQSLVSWSGTMFEYLMPELLLRSCPNTLAGQSRQGVVACQMAAGRALNRPWGVSESGYYAFDLQLNYQYRAFGLPDLALSGTAVQDVVAPYAAALALAEAPEAAADNLRRMCEMGWSGEFGMYEAADYMHLDAGHRPRIVRSHMAHHQGMILCAICNALRDNVFSRSLMEIPEARALRLLLQEKGWERRIPRRRGEILFRVEPRMKPVSGFARNGRKNCLADTQLLHGGSTTALVTARGAVYAWRQDWQLNRFFSDLRSSHEGMYVHVCDPESGREAVLGRNGHVRFDAGSACFREDFAGLKIEMTTTVSPEDGTLYQLIEITNPMKEEREIEITGCMAVAHAPRRDMHAHPTFQNLFVESVRMEENALGFRRKRREPGDPLPELIYLLSGVEVTEYETDLEELTGRTGSIGLPGGIRRRFTGGLGNVLNPCAALRARVRLEPGRQRAIHFALTLVKPGEEGVCMERIAQDFAPRRALQLSSTQLRSMLGHGGVDAASFHLLQRSSALIFDPALRQTRHEHGEACAPADRSQLWAAGISGDLPILLVEIRDLAGLDCVRSAVRMHAFYRMLGVELDFVLIDHHGSDYYQPARGRLSDLLSSSHLNGRFHAPGGAYVLERQHLQDDCYHAIVRAAALHLFAEEDFHTQLRACLDGLLTGEAVRYTPMRPGMVSFPTESALFNGYGGIEGDCYAIFLRSGLLPPAPWSNVLASEQAGAIVTERGGGFAWVENSRSGRLTAFANDILREGWGWMFYLIDEANRRWIRLLPGDQPMADFCVYHAPGESRWRSAAEDIAFEVDMRAEDAGVRFDISFKNEGRTVRHLRLAALVDWLMGTEMDDRAMLRSWSRFDGCFASGTAKGVGCFLADDPQARTGCSLLSLCADGDILRPRGLENLDRTEGGWTLHLPLSLRPGETRRCRFLLGSAEDVSAAYALAREFRSGEALRRSREDWPARLEKMRIETPDTALNFLANGFLQAQTLNARIRGRTGLYQPGGAFGFRDQLQDMLPLIHYEPERVRRHLLYCAARQFEDGDVLHWWHEPYTGVRTRISDDLLFLPYVTAQYVRITGDAGVLMDNASFLQNVEIPRDREDVYAPMHPTPHCATLHQHCMRAFRRAANMGEHGLCRMGAGDWNDGMSRVGAQGRGESIWLSEFMAVCAVDYARIAPDENDRAWLLSLNERLCAAIEKHGWDGRWYLRAYTDDGRKLGGQECDCCRIDLISQAWAVLARLDGARCKSALDAAWEQLADEERKLIRLLTPPFDGQGYDPGYIASYPPGVRENGAQYTHAACWMLYALAEAGDAERAHRALNLLLPLNHARSQAEAKLYRVEPYVMAADIYTEAEHAGRGGWTWYTGSAAWMLMAVLHLLGYERCKNRVRLNALLHRWDEVRVTVRYGLSSYRLVCSRDAQNVMLDGETVDGDFIEMIDDSREHCAVFPPRREDTAKETKEDIFKCIYT